jgi:hypothetical protein
MIRNYLIIVFLLLNSIHLSFGQFRIGPKLGIHPYTVSYQDHQYKDQYDPKIKFGFLAGASLNIPISKVIEIRMDPAYDLRGRKVFVNENGWTMNEIHHFIEMPVQLIFQHEGQMKQIAPFRQIGPVNWYFGIGPNMSYFLGGRGKLETQVMDNPYKISFGGHEGDVDYISFSHANRFMWGLDFSLGMISTLANNNNLNADLKFTYGHTQIGPPNGSTMPILGFSDNLACRYQLLTLSVSYWYKIDLSRLRKGKSTMGQTIRTKKIDTGPKKKTKNINSSRSGKRVKNRDSSPKNINRIKN